MKLLIKIFIFLLSTVYSSAENIPLIVISAGKTKQSIDLVGSSIDIISSKEIDESPYYTIAEVINNNSTSNNFFQLGGIGGNTAIQLRGIEKRYSTVYLDGVKMMDPSSSDGSFYLDNLSKNSIERIEILKGTQSSLYGSNAIGGTINLFTKIDNNKKGSNLSISKGSNSTTDINYSISNSKEKVNYFFGLNKYYTGGISAMNDNDEKDMYRNDNLVIGINYKINDNFQLKNSFRVADTFYEYDEVDKTKPDNNINTDNLEFSNSLKLIYKNKNTVNTLSFNKLLIERYTTNSLINKNNYFGYRDTFSFLSEYNFNFDNKIIYGADFEFDSARYQKDFGISDLEHDESIISQYFDFQFRPFEKIYSSFGFRNDTHSTAKNKKSGRATFAYKINNNNKFRSSFGAGVRFPALYDYAYGYQTIQDKGGSLEELKAERGISFDLGYDTFLPKLNLNLSTTYFRTEQKNSLLSNARTDWVIRNVTGVNTSEGIELSGTWKPINKKFNLNLGYTFTNSYDANTCSSEELISYSDNECRGKSKIATSKVRVPLHALQSNFNYKFNDYFDSLIKAKYISETRDFGNINNNWKDQILPSYTLVDINNNYKISKNSYIFFNINNLFNKEYQQAFGYSSPKRSVYFGFKKLY